MSTVTVEIIQGTHRAIEVRKDQCVFFAPKYHLYDKDTGKLIASGYASRTAAIAAARKKLR